MLDAPITSNSPGKFGVTTHLVTNSSNFVFRASTQGRAVYDVHLSVEESCGYERIGRISKSAGVCAESNVFRGLPIPNDFVAS